MCFAVRLGIRDIEQAASNIALLRTRFKFGRCPGDIDYFHRLCYRSFSAHGLHFASSSIRSLSIFFIRTVSLEPFLHCTQSLWCSRFHHHLRLLGKHTLDDWVTIGISQLDAQPSDQRRPICLWSSPSNSAYPALRRTLRSEGVRKHNVVLKRPSALSTRLEEFVSIHNTSRGPAAARYG